jgi:hypothetical protein
LNSSIDFHYCIFAHQVREYVSLLNSIDFDKSSMNANTMTSVNKILSDLSEISSAQHAHDRDKALQAQHLVSLEVTTSKPALFVEHEDFSSQQQASQLQPQQSKQQVVTNPKEGVVVEDIPVLVHNVVAAMQDDKDDDADDSAGDMSLEQVLVPVPDSELPKLSLT